MSEEIIKTYVLHIYEKKNEQISCSSIAGRSVPSLMLPLVYSLASLLLSSNLHPEFKPNPSTGFSLTWFNFYDHNSWSNKEKVAYSSRMAMDLDLEYYMFILFVFLEPKLYIIMQHFIVENTVSFRC